MMGVWIIHPAFMASANPLLGLGKSSDIATWIIAIGFIVSTIFYILAMMGYMQKFQMSLWKRNIEAKLAILETYATRSRERTKRFLERMKAENPDEIIELACNYFVIDPVSIEPIDIIRRMERILRTAEGRMEELVEKAAAKASEAEKKIAVTLLGITNALNLLYKYVRHLLLWSLKTENPLLLAQLMWQLPYIIRLAKTYYEASKDIEEGKPIGDSAGPYAAYLLINKLTRQVQPPTEIAKDTVYSVQEYKGRKVIVVKAKGPGSNVGRPGEAVEKLATIYGKELAAIITIDAMLKFEGEETGITAEGAGAAIGDPGPEKIRIERAAAKLGVPLHAIGIKMGLEEAIKTVKKEILDGAMDAAKKALRFIETMIPEGAAVIIVGVGNSIGVAQ